MAIFELSGPQRGFFLVILISILCIPIDSLTFRKKGRDTHSPHSPTELSTNIMDLPGDSIVPSGSLYPYDDYKGKLCVICLGQIERVHEEESLKLILGCQHEFHLDCIRKWLKRSEKCPICSKELPSSHLTSIRPLATPPSLKKTANTATSDTDSDSTKQLVSLSMEVIRSPDTRPPSSIFSSQVHTLSHEPHIQFARQSSDLTSSDSIAKNLPDHDIYELKKIEHTEYVVPMKWGISFGLMTAVFASSFILNHDLPIKNHGILPSIFVIFVSSLIFGSIAYILSNSAVKGFFISSRIRLLHKAMTTPTA
jgi:hypothetical protein